MEELEIDTKEHVEKARRAQTYHELIEDNKRLIEENTKLTKSAQRAAAENKKMLKLILEKMEEKK